MIILSNTTDKIQVKVDATVTSEDVYVMTSWRDRTSSTFIADRTYQLVSGTTYADITGSPASSTQRLIDFISIHNLDTVAHVVNVTYFANTTEIPLITIALDAGTTATFVEGQGWSVSNTYQPIKSFTVHGDAGANFAMTNATLAERFAGNTTRHIFAVDLVGYSQVRLCVNKQVAGTAGSIFRAKYYTSYSATVGNYLQLGASAQVETSMAATGYFDSGWMDLASGAKINGCYIAFTESGGDGVADPAIGATDILFR